jgi:hypothetical protein
MHVKVDQVPEGESCLAFGIDFSYDEQRHRRKGDLNCNQKATFEAMIVIDTDLDREFVTG